MNFFGMSDLKTLRVVPQPMDVPEQRYGFPGLKGVMIDRSVARQRKLSITAVFYANDKAGLLTIMQALEALQSSDTVGTVASDWGLTYKYCVVDPGTMQTPPRFAYDGSKYGMTMQCVCTQTMPNDDTNWTTAS